jgi:AcrR family transcriptional regulator
VVDAAMRLQNDSASSVTVAEIAAEAGMTATAVYYHYPSKEDILLEGLATFSDALLAEVFEYLSPALKRPPSQLPLHLLGWAESDRVAATVWFVHSSGLSMVVEALRRETYDAMMDALVSSVRRTRPDCDLATASVIAAALTSLLEVSARAWLSGDDALATDSTRFQAAVAGLGERIVDSRRDAVKPAAQGSRAAPRRGTSRKASA